MANSAGNMYEHLVNQLGGFIFLGTPHQGSQLQKWGSTFAHLASMIEYGETVLMDEVNVKSMKIYDMVSEFTEIMIRLNLAKANAIVCFHENLKTDYTRRAVPLMGWMAGKVSVMVGLIFRYSNGRTVARLVANLDQVVEETSAVLPGLRHVALDSDHLKLNKFASASDGNYVLMSSNIMRIAAQSTQLIQTRRKGDLIPKFHPWVRSLIDRLEQRQL